MISNDGTVLADTLAEPESLDNHADREEIKQALESGSGTSTRFSDTIMKGTVYYAKKLSNGNVLRVSATQDSALLLLVNLIYPISIIIIIALILSLVI